MQKEEFIKLLDTERRSEPTDEEFNLINYVYAFHPSIDEVFGKTDIVLLYERFGMRIIRDMLETAKKSEALESEILIARNHLSQLQEEYNILKG